MSKKIIAISLALLMMVVGFVGCKKNDTNTTVNGGDYLAMTHEDGGIVIDDNNNVVVVVTGKDGEIIEDSEGEPQTRLVKIYDAYVQGGDVYAEHYKLPILDGWTVGEGNKLVKEGTDGKTYIEVVKVKELEEIDGKKETIDDYLVTVDENNQQFVDILENDQAMDKLIKEDPSLEALKGGKVTVDKGNTLINSRRYIFRTFEITDKDGKSIHHAENYYFTDADVIYLISYVSVENVEKIDFADYLNDFVFIP